MEFFKVMCIEQGYIPPTCTMEGQLCWLLVKDGQIPCSGCNADRAICKGLPKKLKEE